MLHPKMDPMDKPHLARLVFAPRSDANPDAQFCLNVSTRTRPPVYGPSQLTHTQERALLAIAAANGGAIPVDDDELAALVDGDVPEMVRLARIGSSNLRHLFIWSDPWPNPAPAREFRREVQAFHRHYSTALGDCR